MKELQRLINELCPDGVEYKPVGSFANVEKGKNTNHQCELAYSITKGGLVRTSDYFKDAKVTSEDTSGYRIVKRNWFVYSPSRIDVGSINYLRDQDEVIVSPLNVVFSINECVILPEYLLYFLQSRYGTWQIITSREGIEGTGRKLLPFEKFSKISVPVPPLPVQRVIIRILDNFTELTAELTAELAMRKKQYEYYKNRLLIFSNYPYYSLSDLCDIVDYRGKTPKKVDSGVFLVTAKNIRQGYIDYDKSQEYISEEDYEDVMHRGIPKIGDVLITTEAPCGYVAQVDKEHIALAQRVIKYRPKRDNLDSTFLKHILLGKEFQDKLLAAATGGTVKGIKGSRLHKLTIPLPPLELQKQIVEILDKFESLCMDISSGLPAEIEARQKQYEYYRDRLLTFNEKS